MVGFPFSGVSLVFSTFFFANQDVSTYLIGYFFVRLSLSFSVWCSSDFVVPRNFRKPVVATRHGTEFKKRNSEFESWTTPSLAWKGSDHNDFLVIKKVKWSLLKNRREMEWLLLSHDPSPVQSSLEGISSYLLRILQWLFATKKEGKRLLLKRNDTSFFFSLVTVSKHPWHVFPIRATPTTVVRIAIHYADDTKAEH